MRKHLFLIIVLMATLPLAAQNNINEISQIEVTGKAEKEVVPDEIYLSITIDQDKSKNKESVASQERKMINALKGLGIDVEKKLTVADMSSDLQTYILRRRAVQTRKSYQLLLHDAEQVNGVFEALAQLDISDTQVTKSTYSDMEGIKMELRKEAMRNARNIADTLAEAIGQEAGAAFYIMDYNNMGGSVNYNGLVMSTRAMKSSAEMITEEAADSGLEFKKLKFSYSVNVRFHLYPSAPEAE